MIFKNRKIKFLGLLLNVHPRYAVPIATLRIIKTVWSFQINYIMMTVRMTIYTFCGLIGKRNPTVTRFPISTRLSDGSPLSAETDR